MNKLIIAACAVVLATVAAEAKNAGKLPKNAVPMTTEEIKQILSGNSIDYKVAKYYFAPDGSLLGIDGKKTWFADGTWTVTGNTWCLDSKWHGPDKASDTYAQCEEKYKAGKKIYSKNVKGEDKYLGDISTDQEKKIKKGDIVSASVTALKKKLGYQ
ncbi:MAG: DUF995 domain-containing protein [Parvibaculaceae bacterium]